MSEDEIECTPVAELYELRIIAADPLAASNAGRVYSPLKFTRIQPTMTWEAIANLAPKAFAERIAGKLAMIDGIRLKLEVK